MQLDWFSWWGRLDQGWVCFCAYLSKWFWFSMGHGSSRKLLNYGEVYYLVFGRVMAVWGCPWGALLPRGTRFRHHPFPCSGFAHLRGWCREKAFSYQFYFSHPILAWFSLSFSIWRALLDYASFKRIYPELCRPNDYIPCSPMIPCLALFGWYRLCFILGS